MKRIHVVFDNNSAHSIREYLRRAGRDESVLALQDDLSYGPISPDLIELRRAWIRHELGSEPAKRLVDSERFWASVADERLCPTVWYGRQNAREYAGFLAFVSRWHAPLSVVDITHVTVVTQHGEFQLRATAELSPESLTVLRLDENTQLLSPQELGAYRVLWSRLRGENAAFRVPHRGELRSAPITHFDALITHTLRRRWIRAQALIATILARWKIDEYVIMARLKALAATGSIECRTASAPSWTTDVRIARSAFGSATRSH